MLLSVSVFAKFLPVTDHASEVFAALSHESRRHIVVLLALSDGELPSGYLAAKFAHSWPTTTRHLSVLEKAGIVKVRREGRNSKYRLDRSCIAGVLEKFLTQITPTEPDYTWTPKGPRSAKELADRRHPKKGSPS